MSRDEPAGGPSGGGSGGASGGSSVSSSAGLSPGGLGRRRRVSDDETRRRMLDAASDVIMESGLTVSLEHLSYEAVIRRADVSRSAAYRIWPSKDEFFEDLLRLFAGPMYRGAAAFDPMTVKQAVTSVAIPADRLSDPQERLNALVEAARVGALRNYESLMEQPHWRTYVALNATVLSMPDVPLRRRITESLQASEATFLASMATFYRHMSRCLGFRLRAPFHDEYLLPAALGAAVVEGLGLRRIVSADLVAKRFELAGFGSTETAEWSVPALGFTAILTSLVEPDPDFDPSTLPGHLAELVAALPSLGVTLEP